MFGKPISCTVNPAVEKEEIDEAPVKKKYLLLVVDQQEWKLLMSLKTWT